MSATNIIEPELANRALEKIPLKDGSEADITNKKIKFKNGEKINIRREQENGIYKKVRPNYSGKKNTID